MPRFFVDLPLQVLQQLELPVETTRHLNVVRQHLDSEIVLFNGDGFDYKATLNSITKRFASATIIDKQANLLSSTSTSGGTNITITLAMCLIANDKFDLVLQKAVELAVNAIIPINSSYSQRLSKEKLASRYQRWRQIIISACEQCGSSVLPTISPVIEFNEFINNILPPNISNNPSYTFIAHPDKSIDSAILSDLEQQFNSTIAKVSTNLSPNSSDNLPKNTQQIVILIGPEGGFTELELKSAVHNGCIRFSLGKRILRAETAAIGAISMFKTLCKIW